MTSGRGGLIVIEKDSVSFVPVASRTWIVNANTPSVVGTPVMPPELTPWVNSSVPGGSARRPPEPDGLLRRAASRRQEEPRVQRPDVPLHEGLGDDRAIR